MLGVWAGLGYHRAPETCIARRKNLCDGFGRQVFPRSSAELRELPGVGAYTAAAIAAIAFGERIAAMDANAERVIARLFAVQSLPKAKAKLAVGRAAVPRRGPGISRKR